jgi:hypothetical protein
MASVEMETRFLGLLAHILLPVRTEIVERFVVNLKG